MELSRKLEKAQTIIGSFKGANKERLQGVCLEIKSAQKKLNDAAEVFFDHCMARCQGLCCRNIYINDIVTLLDLTFILTIHPDLVPVMEQCAGGETFFSADCLFLRSGIGPCIFAADTKPERCIVTFCSDTGSVNCRIRSVRSAFSRLSRYVKIHRPFLWFGF